MKKIFEKTKRDMKFKMAGPGHKLNEESAKPIQVAEQQVKRSEPCNEARQAGMAALARHSGTGKAPAFKVPIVPCSSSNKESAESHVSDLSDEKLKSISNEKELMAVEGVYWKCPLLGPEVLTKQEWKERIAAYLQDQMLEDHIFTPCIMIHTLNKNREKIEQCIEGLCTYLENIISHPGEDKYRRIRVNNRFFQEKIGKMEGTREFLNAAGFQSQMLPANEGEEEFYVYMPEHSEPVDLEMLMDALRSSSAISIELDRNLQVLHPSQASLRVQLPDDFFSLTPEELKKEQQNRADRMELSMQLRTKAMREKEEKREMKKYKFSLIRIRFPDGIFLQGTFAINERFSEVVSFVKDALAVEGAFSLQTALGNTITEDEFNTSLFELKLVPAVMLTFVWEHEGEHPKQFLKNEVLIMMQPLQ